MKSKALVAIACAMGIAGLTSEAVAEPTYQPLGTQVKVVGDTDLPAELTTRFGFDGVTGRVLYEGYIPPKEGSVQQPGYYTWGVLFGINRQALSNRIRGGIGVGGMMSGQTGSGSQPNSVTISPNQLLAALSGNVSVKIGPIVGQLAALQRLNGLAFMSNNSLGAWLPLDFGENTGIDFGLAVRNATQVPLAAPGSQVTVIIPKASLRLRLSGDCSNKRGVFASRTPSFAFQYDYQLVGADSPFGYQFGGLHMFSAYFSFEKLPCPKEGEAVSGAMKFVPLPT